MKGILNCAILVITCIFNKLAKSIRLKENLKVTELIQSHVFYINTKQSLNLGVNNVY